MQQSESSNMDLQAITTINEFGGVGPPFLDQVMQQQAASSRGNANTVLVSAYSVSPMVSAPGAPRMSFADMVGPNTSAGAGVAALRLPLMSPVGMHGLPPGPRTPDGQPLLSPMGHPQFANYGFPPVMPSLESPNSMLQTRLQQHSPGFTFPQPSPLHSHQQPVFFPGPFEEPRAPPVDKMSWLDAAELVLQAAQQPLPMKEIRTRIMEQGLVGASPRSSLETVMLRDAQKGSKRFVKIDGDLQLFRLMTPEEKKAARKSSKKSKAAAAAAAAATTSAKTTTSAVAATTTKASATATSTATAKATSTASSTTVAKTEGNAQAIRSAKFKRKSQNLRRLIKAMVFENAALCDEVARTEAKLPRARAERRFLLLRLLHYQALTGQSILDSDRQTAKKEAEKKKEAERLLNKERKAEKLAARKEKNKEKKEEKEKEKDRENDKDKEKEKDKDKDKEKDKEKKKDKNRHKHKKNKKNSKDPEKKPEAPPAKKKKPSSSLKRHILPIPHDEEGHPIFPIVLGSLTVYSLGEALPDSSSFHSDRFIYPAGFHSTRMYGSMRDPKKRCTYTCKIINSDGDARFDIIDDNDPPAILSANSATRCHRKLLQAVNKAFGEDIVNESRDRAQEFFGVSHPTIQNLIQGLAGASSCSSYRWLRFEECKPEERAKIAHWYESDPTVCYDGLQSAYRKKMAEKQTAQLSAASPSSPTTQASSSSVSTPAATLAATPAATPAAMQGAMSTATPATLASPAVSVAALSVATTSSDSHNLRSLLTSAPILSPQHTLLRRDSFNGS